MRTHVTLPVEVGGPRRMRLPVLGESTCRACGEAILRVNGDDWIHDGRAGGTAYDHSARPSANHVAPHQKAARAPRSTLVR